MIDVMIKKPLSAVGILAMGLLFGFLFCSVHFDRTDEVKNLQLQMEQCRQDVVSCGDDSQRCQTIVRRYK